MRIASVHKFTEPGVLAAAYCIIMLVGRLRVTAGWV
jgi:hypothetical protein